MRSDEPLVALGDMLTDLSGDASQWDAKRLHALATRYGYRMALIVTHTTSTPERVTNLLAMVHRMNAIAVFTPSTEHLDVLAIRELLAELDGVTTLNPEKTFQPHAIPKD